jgi:glycosyltransferase involved in cell wall biosynthesis
MTLKVMHVIDHLGFGGGPILVRTIADNISSSEFECLICQLRAKPESVSQNAKLITLTYGKYDPRTVFAMARLCREQKIDVLHAHLEKSIISCLLSTFFCDVPVVIHEHGAIFGKGVYSLIYRLTLRMLYRRAAAVIANSQVTARQLVKKAAIKEDLIEIISIPIDFNIFDCNRVSRGKNRKNLNISSDDFVVGYVGRLHPVKGVDILIRAFTQLLQRSARYLLVLAGDGPQRKFLETLTSQLGIGRRVRFLGMRDDVPEVMAAFDIGVVPSRQESFGMVLVELMSMKIPVVSSGKGGLAELVKDQVTGLVTRENNPDEIYLCIQRLAEDEGLRNRLAEAAYAFSKKFGPAELIRKIEEIDKRLCRDKKM